MTAIVGVLNKHAVAIAADSAVTMGNTHKVVNSANNIFTLSKYRPVAVMVYSQADFMGTPWDIVIKEYRKQLGDRCFPHLEDYLTDFVSFLHNRHFFCDDQTQHEWLVRILDLFYNVCFANVSRQRGISTEHISTKLLEAEFARCVKEIKKVEKSIEFVDWSLEEFNKCASSDIEAYAKDRGFENYTLLAEAFYYYLSAKISMPFYSGLVFVGYGEDEIYPSLYPMRILFGIDNHLKYVVEDDEIVKISEHGPEAVIAPFAQIDVTQTIVRGINPGFQDIIHNVIDRFVQSLPNDIANILAQNPVASSAASVVKNLNFGSVADNITQQITQEMYVTYTNTLLNTVASLDKEDMANMAESFISLTSLVRRMQPSEETVGGPVDVAVISKGDGFVWINRKHYFKPELNAPFFSNYFK